MRFDLKRPCELCPFVNTDRRITFACRERAEEIEEIAYRQGFVCHEHAECIEDDLETDGFYPRVDGSSQHCWGAIAMYVKNGDANVPWEMMSDKAQNRWWDRADMKALKTVFDGVEEFLEANNG